MKLWKKVSLVSLTVILFICGGVFLKIYNTYSKVNVVKVNKNNLGLKPTVDTADNKKDKKEVINIALFGIDSRDIKNDRGSRSDTIMILTIDQRYKQIKLASIVRDSYVDIEGHGRDKITHAYAFGGPELAIKTLNQNFDLNISRFVTVNFYSLATIIDHVGGITVDVAPNVAPLMNKYIDQVAEEMGKTPKHIERPGKQKLDGIQAVVYSRIRKTIGGDYKRTERQREVISILKDKLKNTSPTQLVGLVDKMAPYVKTNIEIGEMLDLGKQLLTDGYNMNIKEAMFPEFEYSTESRINGIYYFVTDIKKCRDALQSFVYGLPSDRPEMTH